MSESKAMILGCAGRSLTRDEVRFYRGEAPWGFIVFSRNLCEPEQIHDLVAAMRDCVGRPDAPVFIDQEGGRVQRLRPPLAPNYPSAAALGALYGDDKAAGLRAAWLLSRLHAIDLGRYGITANCLPVLDVPVEGANDVIGNRAYGRTATQVAALGRAAADGLMAGGLLPVMKHVPGHGRAQADTHLALPTVDTSLADLQRQDFAPFRELADLPIAMTAHVIYSAIDPKNPATTVTLIDERMAAQDALGVPEFGREPLTKDEALALSSVVANALPGQDQVQAMRDVVAGIQQGYGKHADDVLRQVLAQRGIDRDLAVYGASVMKKLAAGDTPTRADGRTGDKLTDAGNADRGMTGGSGGVTVPAFRQIPNTAQISRLIGSPDLAAQFDEKFGAGTARYYLDADKLRAADRKGFSYNADGTENFDPGAK